MACIETRHRVTVSNGRILVGVEIQRMARLLYDAEASLSPDEARRAVEAVDGSKGRFRSEDGRLAVWATYGEGRIQWFSKDEEGVCEDFSLGSDCWSAEFVKDIEHAIVEAEA